MILIKSLFLLFLISFSTSSFAVSWYSTLQQAFDNCQAYIAGQNSNIYNAPPYRVPTAQDFSCVFPDPFGVCGSQCYAATSANYPTMNRGWYGSTTPVICTAPQVKNTSTGLCQTPPACTSGTYYDNPSNSCKSLPECTNNQNPLTSNCVFPKSKGLGINCANGTTVYVPSVCPPTGSRWQDVFPASKPMCGPLDTDHTNCTPLLFQAFDDFASSHAIQYATAVLALLSIPELAFAPEIAGVIGGVAVEARAVWDGVFHNSAGEVVDVKVQGDIPKSVMGDALTDYFKKNPTAPYTSQFPEAYNQAAPQAPIVVEPNTGVVHPVNSTVPLSPNQVWDAAKQLSPTATIPYTQLAPYITPERIPWVAESAPSMTYDIANQQAPVNYPQWTRTTSPLQSSSPYYQVSPNPLVTPVPFLPSTPQSITGIQPIPFTPLSPAPIPAPALTPTTQPPANYNPNPTGSDTPVSNNMPVPDPETPIDPNLAEIPPVPPDFYPDTYKYFDWMPMKNPLSFDVRDYLPSLPEPTCYYEVHSTFHVPFLGIKHLDVAPCVPLQPLRTVLAWVFSVVTIMACFFIIFRSSF